MLGCVNAGYLHLSEQGDLGVTSRAAMVAHKQNASMSDEICLDERAMVRNVCVEKGAGSVNEGGS